MQILKGIADSYMNMRNTLFIVTLAAGLTTMTSCKKEYVCTCAGGISYQVYEKEVKATNKEKAREKCEGNNMPPNTPDVINCWLE